MANILLDQGNKGPYLLKCPVCKSRYDMNTNVPLILPCLRTVCTDCVIKSLHGTSYFCPYPSCGRTHNAMVGEAEHFPEDSLAMLLLNDCKDGMNVGKTKWWCEKCGDERYVKIFCSTCVQIFCSKCINDHKDSKPSEDHINFNINEILNAERNKKSVYTFSTCTTSGHEGFRLDMYCSGKTCNYPICKQCKKQHSDTSFHRTQPLIEVVPKLKQEIVKLFTDLETIEQILHRKKERCKQELEKKQSILKDVVKNIDAYATEKKKESMKKVANQKMIRKIKIVENDLKTVNAHLNNICSIRRSAKYSVAFKFIDAFIEDADKLKKQIKTITDSTVHAYPSTSLEMVFCPGHLLGSDHAKESEMVLSTMAFPPFTNIEIPKSIFENDIVEFSILLRNYKKVPIEEPYLDVEVVVTNNGYSIKEKCVPRGNCYVGSFSVNTTGKHKMEVWAIKRKLLLGSIIFDVADGEPNDDEQPITCVRLEYGAQAFPKIRHLLGEYRMLAKSLHSLLGIVGMTVTNDFTSELKEYLHNSSNHQQKRGVIPVSTEQIFAYEDVLVNPDVDDVYINVIGTQDNMETLRQLVSPKSEPKSVKYPGNIDAKCCFHECNSQDSWLRSSLYSAPEIYICWIPKDFDQVVQHQLSDILKKFDRRTHDRLFFVTDSDCEADTIFNLKQELRRLYFDFDEHQNRDLPVVCSAIQENVRKEATFTLSEYIFGRLTVLKKILLNCEENTRNIQSNQRDICLQCISAAVHDTKIPDMPEHGDPEISDIDRKCQQLCKLLEKKVFHVNSLLQQNPRKERKVIHKDIPKNSVKKLLGLKEWGVEAFGVWSDEFRVYLNIDLKKEDEIKQVETEIREIIDGEFTRVNIIHCKGQIIVKYVEKGDELYRDGSEKYGTLGIFAYDSSGNLLALTSEHVIDKDQKAHVVIDGERLDLGICHEIIAENDTCRHASDISLIKIHPENHSKCNTEFKSQTGDVLQPHLFRGKNLALRENIVYKKGAKTNWTTGSVRGDINHKEVPYIMVQGLDGEFAEPGDSGSIVFTYDIHDTENTKINLVSMVVAGGDIEGILTYRLDQTLDKLPPNTIEFDKRMTQLYQI